MVRRLISALVLILTAQTFLTPQAWASGTPGSIAFNGGQHLTTTVSSVPGTGNFTIEFWFYLQDAAAPNQGLFNTRSDNTKDGLDAQVNANSGTSGILGVSYKGTWLYESAAGAIQSKTWYHLALVRVSTYSLKVYLNGELLRNVTLDGDGINFTSSHMIIGAIGGNTFPISGKMTGNISNFRYTKSIVYSANFTPVRSTLTALADTKVLLQTYNDGSFLTDSAPGSLGFTNNGGAIASEISPFVDPISQAEKDAQAAAQARAEYQKRVDEARARLVAALNARETISTAMLSTAEIYGSHPGNIVAINQEIYAMPNSSTPDISLVSKIVYKYETLGRIQSGGRFYYPELVTAGILQEESSVRRSVVMRYLKSEDPQTLGTPVAIVDASKKALAGYEARKAMVAKLIKGK